MRIKETEDKNHVRKVREALRQNDGYCPCRIEKTPETKCICKEFLEQEEGECLCGLYVKEEDRWVGTLQKA